MGKGCGKCSKPFQTGTVPPNQFQLNCNKMACSLANMDPNGVGMGVNYNSTPSAVFQQPMSAPNSCMSSKAHFNHFAR